MAKETTNSAWDKILQGIFAMPGIAVARSSFLEHLLKPFAEKGLLSSVDIKLIINEGHFVERYLGERATEKMAKSEINHHTTIATSVSTLSGLPGGFVMAAAIPADLAQYYFNVFILAQKLAYIYGYPDLRDENGKLSDTAANVLTIFVGVMSGVGAANTAVKVLSQSLARETIKQLPKYALTKTLPYQLAKSVAMEIGFRLTKRTFAQGVGKAIPIVGGLISGVITLSSFRPSALKLLKALKNDELKPEP